MLQQAEQLAATEEAWMLHNAVQASLQDGPGQGQWGSGDVEEQLLQAGLRESLREQEARARQGLEDLQQQQREQAHGSDSVEDGGPAQRQQGQPSNKRPRNN
jgi:hypothetical protein